MDVEKLREYASQPTHTMKRKLNKKSKEIIAQFENLDTVEKTQLLSISLLKDELKEPLKLLGIDTSVKKRNILNYKKILLKVLRKGYTPLGKNIDLQINPLNEE